MGSFVVFLLYFFLLGTYISYFMSRSNFPCLSTSLQTLTQKYLPQTSNPPRTTPFHPKYTHNLKIRSIQTIFPGWIKISVHRIIYIQACKTRMMGILFRDRFWVQGSIIVDDFIKWGIIFLGDCWVGWGLLLLLLLMGLDYVGFFYDVVCSPFHHLNTNLTRTRSTITKIISIQVTACDNHGNSAIEFIIVLIVFRRS